MSHAKENQHKKLRALPDGNQITGAETEHNVEPKEQNLHEHKTIRDDLNPQEDGETNACPDDKTNNEPREGSVCEFQ
jgi:hypothetical protein